MPEFTAKDVQRLRQSTGAGMMDAKRALQESDGDFEAATKWLREKGLAQSLKRSDRENTQGAIAVYNSGGAGAVVELKSETDFVAKSADFVNLVGDIAEAVAAKGDDAAAGFAEAIDSLKVSLKENIELGRVVRFEAASGNVLDTYLHVQNERGVNGVMVELAGGHQALAHQVALQIAFSRPRYLSRADVPESEIAAEREVLEAATRNEGKPEQSIPKIVDGKLNAFFSERCLLDQKSVQDNKQTIAQMLGDATVVRFTQVEIGG